MVGGNLVRLSGPLKSIGSFCCGACSKKVNSVLNGGLTAGLRQLTTMPPTSRCHITFSPMKYLPLCDAAFHQNSLSSCLLLLLFFIKDIDHILVFSIICPDNSFHLCRGPAQVCVHHYYCADRVQ